VRVDFVERTQIGHPVTPLEHDVAVLDDEPGGAGRLF
jgi:hypothetical protein